MSPTAERLQGLQIIFSQNINLYKAAVILSMRLLKIAGNVAKKF